MKRTVYVCDKCKRESETNLTTKVEFQIRPSDQTMVERDLCNSCKLLLLKFFGMLPKETETT